MAVNQIPTSMQNANGYINKKKVEGAVDITLPNFEAATQTIEGLGILGSIDIPIDGHFPSQTSTINFRSIEQGHLDLYTEKRELVVRASELAIDDAGGSKRNVPIKVTIRGPVKNLNFGKVKPGEPMIGSLEQEIMYFKYEKAGKILLELDKVNYVYKVNGVDLLEETRKQI